jgi:hypothetical protein
MAGPHVYKILVEGLLPEHWSDWFAGMTLIRKEPGYTVLSGPVVDQSALFGVLGKIQALNLTLVSVTRRPAAPGGRAWKHDPAGE